jgi:hypothetical protein
MKISTKFRKKLEVQINEGKDEDEINLTIVLQYRCIRI